MPMKRYKPEQIVTLLRQIQAEIANGKTIARLPGSRKLPNSPTASTCSTKLGELAR